MIVVDDGSTDDTLNVVRRYPMVAYIWQPNAGLAAARNTGLASVTTDTVCFLDADDTLSPGYIDGMTAALANDLEAAFAYSSIQMMGSDTRRLRAPEWSVEALCRDNYVSATSLFRTAAIGATRFDTRLRGWEDWDFALSLAARGLRGIAVPQLAFGYRKHWDEPSMFDVLGRRRLPAALARRHVARKHRALFTPAMRRDALLHVVRALVSDARRLRVM